MRTNLPRYTRGDITCPSRRTPLVVARTTRHGCSSSLTRAAMLPIDFGSINIDELMNVNDACYFIAILPRPWQLTFHLLTLLVLSDWRMTMTTCVPTSVFLGLSVFKFFANVHDRQTDVRQSHRLMSPYTCRGHNNCTNSANVLHAGKQRRSYVLISAVTYTRLAT